MKLNKETYRVTEAGPLANISLGVGGVGLAAVVVGFLALGGNTERLSHAYLIAFVFWLTIGLGGLFFTLVHHLVDATWSVVVRRLAESVMSTIPWLVWLFLPILLWGVGDLYHWTHPGDEVVVEKSAFLNVKVFTAGSVLCFVIWWGIVRLLRQKSLQQDKAPSEALSGSMRMISGPSMVLFALSLSFAAFTWLMSLNPHWYSTIYAVTVFAGSFVSALSFMTLTLLLLRRKGVLAEEVTIEHYHDLGKLIFAFTIFWTYVSFSQYFLMWYGNLPEETQFFHHRWEGSWKGVSLFLIFGHFVIPFLFLLSREPKRNVTCMLVASVWMLVMHWVEMYWQVLPYWSHHQSAHGISISLWDPIAFIGVGGVFLSVFWRQFLANPIIPVGDQNLAASLRFTNM